MRGVAVKRLDVEHTKRLVNIVGSHCCSPSMTHKPGSFLVFVSMAMTTGLPGVLGAPTSTTWCILYSTSLARADATVSGRPVTLSDSAMSCVVRDQHEPPGEYEISGYADRLWFVNPCALASQPSRFRRFAHLGEALGRSSELRR